MALLHQQPAVLDDQQRPADPAGVPVDGQLEVEVLALVDELLRIHPHLLHQFLQKPAEQEGQQRTGQVQPLVAVLIPVIQVVRLDLSQ